MKLWKGKIYAPALAFYLFLVYDFFTENWDNFNLNVLLILTCVVFRGNLVERENEN